jgi:hypothetical protein
MRGTIGNTTWRMSAGIVSLIAVFLALPAAAQQPTSIPPLTVTGTEAR